MLKSYSELLLFASIVNLKSLKVTRNGRIDIDPEIQGLFGSMFAGGTRIKQTILSIFIILRSILVTHEFNFASHYWEVLLVEESRIHYFNILYI